MHLDGSIRIPTLIDLAKQIGMELPSYDPAELKRLVFKDHYADLTVRQLGLLKCSCVAMLDACNGLMLLQARVCCNVAMCQCVACVRKGTGAARSVERRRRDLDKPLFA